MAHTGTGLEPSGDNHPDYGPGDLNYLISKINPRFRCRQRDLGSVAGLIACSTWVI